MIDDGPWGGVPIGGLGTREHRPDASWRLRPLAPRGRPPRVRGRSRRTPSRSTWAGPTTRAQGRPRSCRRFRPMARCRAGAGRCPSVAATYHALFPRAWQTFEPDVLGIRLIGEQLSPVIAGDLVASALPVGVFEWWIENPGPDRLTVGLMLTWQDPSADPDVPAPAGAWHETIDLPDAGGAVLHAPAGAPSGLRGTFALAASRAPGVDVTVRSRFDARSDTEVWADFARDGRLDASDDRTPSRDGEAIGAAVAATVELAPGERRSVRFALAWDMPIVEFGAGRQWWKRYTRDWGRTGERAFELATHALERTPAWRNAIEAWQRPVLEATDRPDWYKAALFNELYFLVDGGTFWEAGEVGGPEPDPDDPGRFALLECLDYRFYDTVDVDFYASFAILRLFPELEARGIRDLLETIPVDDPDIVEIEASGQARPAQGRRHGAARRWRPRRRPVLPPEPLHLPGRQWLEGPRSQVRAPGLARRGRRPLRWRRADPRRLADRRRGPDRLVGTRPRWRRSARTRRAARPDLRHVADVRTLRLRRLAVAGRGGRRRADGSPVGTGRGRETLGGLVRAWPGGVRRAALAGRSLRVRRWRRPELRQRDGRPAGRPVVCRCDRARRPHPARPRGRRAAHDPPSQRVRLRRRARWAP